MRHTEDPAACNALAVPPQNMTENRPSVYSFIARIQVDLSMMKTEVYIRQMTAHGPSSSISIYKDVVV